MLYFLAPRDVLVPPAPDNKVRSETPPPRVRFLRNEEKKANQAAAKKQKFKDPVECINKQCALLPLMRQSHSVRGCMLPCQLDDCTRLDEHNARSCPLIYGDNCGAYFQSVTVCPSSSSPVLVSRSHARHARIPRNPPSPGRKTLKQGPRIVSGNSPQESSTDATKAFLPDGITPPSVQLDPTVVLQYDPGATHLFTPKPLDSHASVTSYRDTLLVADGLSVPIVGKSMLGPVETFIAPSLTHALVPQSAFEALDLLSVMSAGQLQLFERM